jgi:predicted transcriptional regulator
MVRAGATNSELAELLGCSRQAVSRRLKAFGIPPLTFRDRAALKAASDTRCYSINGTEIKGRNA